MSSKELRTYAVTGELETGHWKLFEDTFKRLGLGVEQVPEGEDDASDTATSLTSSLERTDFYAFADANPAFNMRIAGRSWNLLARIYSCRLFPGDLSQIYGLGQHYVPTAFAKSPLEYEYAPDPEPRDHLYRYAQKLGGLRVESLASFMSLVDSTIREADGNIRNANLPEGMGTGVINYLGSISRVANGNT